MFQLRWSQKGLIMVWLEIIGALSLLSVLWELNCWYDFKGKKIMVELHSLCYVGYSLELLLPLAGKKSGFILLCYFVVWGEFDHSFRARMLSFLRWYLYQNTMMQFNLKGKTKGEEGRYCWSDAMWPQKFTTACHYNLCKYAFNIQLDTVMIPSLRFVAQWGPRHVSSWEILPC